MAVVHGPLGQYSSSAVWNCSVSPLLHIAWCCCLPARVSPTHLKPPLLLVEVTVLPSVIHVRPAVWSQVGSCSYCHYCSEGQHIVKKILENHTKNKAATWLPTALHLVPPIKLQKLLIPRCTPVFELQPHVLRAASTRRHLFHERGVAAFIGKTVILQKICSSWSLCTVCQVPNTIFHVLCNSLLKLEPLKHSITC